MVAVSTPQQRVHQTHLVRGTLNGALAKDLVLGPFMVAYAVQVQGLSNGEITWFLSAIPLLIVLRYPFLGRIAHIPRITVLHWARYVQMSCLVALLVIPSNAISLPVMMLIGAWFVFGNEFLQNAVWMNLVAEVSARSDRGRFLGRLRTRKQATNMCFAALGFVLVGDALSQDEFNILLCVVLLLLLNSRYWYGKLPATPPPARIATFAGSGQMSAIIRNNPILRRPLALTLIAAVLDWPILIVYVVGVLHLPANVLMLTVVAGMLGSIVSEVFWGRHADAHGIRQVFMIFFACSIALYPLLLLVPDFASVQRGSVGYYIGTAVLLLFYFLRGVLSAGQMMATSMYRAIYLNEPGGFHAVNILTALNQIFTGALTALGGIILVGLSTGDITAWGPLWVDQFRASTLAIMVLTILVGLWIAIGIKVDFVPKQAARDSVS